MMVLVTLYISLSLVWGSVAKKWNNTGKGSVIFEEAVSLNWPVFSKTSGAPPPGQSYTDLLDNLGDIHYQRLQWMDESGVDYMVLSLSSPGVQEISNAALAETTASRVNDEIAKLISNNTARFGAFASLSMHNATQAAGELRRCITELGFHGALLNDFQQAGEDNSTLHYYDTTDYDPFWSTVQELDVPVYLHPRTPTPLLTKLKYSHSPWLLGAPHQFAVDLSTHVVGLCANGVFDRFPKLKVVVGHLGERIPSDFWRIDEMLARRIPDGLPMNRTFSSYWLTNLYETSAGNFGTSLLNYHRGLIGEDRILYSVDYPFVMMQQGAAWVDTLTDSQESRLKFVRGNAMKLLKLDQD